MSGKDVMPLPKDVRPVVDALVGDFARISKTVSFTQVALHGGKEVPGWVGAAADAYTDQILKLGGHARKASSRHRHGNRGAARMVRDCGGCNRTQNPAAMGRIRRGRG